VVWRLLFFVGSRSPNPSNSYYASYVNNDGYLNSGNNVNNSNNAVRPCLCQKGDNEPLVKRRHNRID
jgi:hypothetical protein